MHITWNLIPRGKQESHGYSPTFNSPPSTFSPLRLQLSPNPSSPQPPTNPTLLPSTNRPFPSPQTPPPPITPHPLTKARPCHLSPIRLTPCRSHILPLSRSRMLHKKRHHSRKSPIARHRKVLSIQPHNPRHLPLRRALAKPPPDLLPRDILDQPPQYVRGYPRK